MTAILITLPYPPTINHLYTRTRYGNVTLTAEARHYRVVTRLIASSARLEIERGPIAVDVSVYRPQRRGDLDNVLKALLDSLNGVLWVDDDQIVELHAYRYDDAYNPRVELRIGRR